MAEKVENLVLEHLRHIRKAVDEMQLDMVDMKARMSSVEGTLGHVMTQLAVQSGRMDRIEERLGRIERRLELADA
jgi:archaellum component FlaC